MNDDDTVECIICGAECDPALMEDGICFTCDLLDTGCK